MINKKAEDFVKRNFLLLSLCAAVILYALFFTQSTLSPDETGNLLLGKKILQFQYPEDFFHRMPLVPFMVSPFFLAGLGADAARFAVPLIFILLSVISTYMLARQVGGERVARLSVILLLSFAMFWRWGTYVLVDIPLMALGTLALHFFLMGLRDRRNFYTFGFFLGLSSVTKLSFAILPAILVAYLLVRRKKRVLMSREFWAGISISVIIFAAFFTAVYAMKGSMTFEQIESVTEHVSDQEGSVIMQVITGAEYTSASNFMKLILTPFLIFAPFGLLMKFRMKRLLAVYSIILFSSVIVLWVVRLRYFSPIYPMAMIFCAQGYLFLRQRMGKKAVDAFFILLIFASLLGTFYIISLDSQSLRGAGALTDYTGTLHGLIASDYLPDYINITADVLTDANLTSQIFYGNFSEDILRRSGVRYLVLSVYDEWNRAPDTAAYFHPALGPLEIPFISRPYSNGRVPPDYTFRSPLYEDLESSPGLSRLKEIKIGTQTVFIVYEVV